MKKLENGKFCATIGSTQGKCPPVFRLLGRYIHLTGPADAGSLTGNRKGREVTMDIKKIALFAAGTLFGSAGFKLLSSKDAKKVYTQTTAAVLRMKDSTMETVSKVQEQAGDILADAKAINEARAVEAEAAVIEDAAEETTEETAE